MSQTQQMSPSETMEREDEIAKEDKKTKTRRPPNTAFRQQRLKAWQPILTPKTVLPLFFAVGIIFAPIGGLLIWASSQVQELSIDYTNCANAAPSTAFGTLPNSRVSSSFRSSNYSSNLGYQWMQRTEPVAYGLSRTYTVDTTVCSIQFDIPTNIGPPVLFYYRLTKFYQNHRRYVKSLNQDQINGKFVSNDTINNSDCSPLTSNNSGFAYYPCGLIANSQFNDTFQSPVLLNVAGSSANNQTYVMLTNGTAWNSDGNVFKQTVYTADQVAPPPNWRVRYPYGYNDDFPVPNIHLDQGLQTWMRTSGLPTFSKLALRNDTTAMSSGRYQVDIYDYFPSQVYGGTKSIIISTRTVIGGKNPFLGIAYIVVGGICLVLGVIFTATHLIRPRKLGDHTYLSWNNDQANTGMTMGRSARQNQDA